MSELRDRLLDPGGTDPDTAEQALADLYRIARLDPPAEIVWADSPPAAARRALRKLVERRQEIRRLQTLDGDLARQRCWCRWCRGLSVMPLLYPRERAPIADGFAAQISTQAGRLLDRAVERETGYPFPGSHQIPTAARAVPIAIRADNPWTARPFAPHPDACTHARGEEAKLFVDAWHRLACTAGWWFPYRGFAVLSARPVAAHYDDWGRPHRIDGPALEFADGWKVYAIGGMEAAPAYFEPGHPTLDDVLGEPDPDIRRVLIDRYGVGRFAAEAGAGLVHEDESGRLWEVEGMRMVEVVDATPHPDGLERSHWLHVPPECRTARQGVAWSFGLAEFEYRPEWVT